ncbi:unnamed protein product [Larinioides sclopetarius]|uniref:Apple domain-containing protein n=1 Tax=Larinioides sclopetarius TaxID=280406 RepID=A0AAV1YW19_9ARAC
MDTRFNRISCIFVLFCVTFSVQAQDEDSTGFPHIADLEIEFYETTVTLTDEDQQVTALVKEYYDSTGPRGKLEILENGDKRSIYYNNDTNQILELTTTTCKAWAIDESIYLYQPVFYGWLNKDPLIIGPSALLWYAQTRRNDIKTLGTTIIRDISCDTYSLDINTRTDNVTVIYHFSAKTWTTPYALKDVKAVPIRIEVRGVTRKNSRDDRWQPKNIFTDFSYFRPTISDWLVLQPPMGIGCPLRKSSRTIPKIPKVFKYTAEVYDSVKAKKNPTTDIETQIVWYDKVRNMARLDKFNALRTRSEFYDFNTGVTYSNLDDSTCTIEPLRNSIFEGYDGELIGHLKEPGEVLNLDGRFYYMGERTIRGIKADSFESIQRGVTFMKQSLRKLVVTVFFSEDYYTIAVNGEIESQIPIYYIITGWNNDTNILFQLHYNIFAFDDMIYPDMYKTFDLTRCFPTMEEKSYFMLILNVPPPIAAEMEEADDMVTLELKWLIAKVAQVSDMRIPLLTADYKSQGVYVTGLMLERPPALAQFFLEYTGETKTRDKDVKVVMEAKSKEQCAFACVDENSFTCKGFYFCNEACFIKSEGILTPSEDDDNIEEFGVCETWLRAETRSNNKEHYLFDAMSRLEATVVNDGLSYYFKVNDTYGENLDIADIIIGDGPFTGNENQEKPYTTVIKFSKLRAGDETTVSLHEVDNLNDCYKACKNSDDINCASFSYCPDSDNKQCMISSVLVVNRKNNPEDTDDDKNCYVYSLKYLDFYDAYPGRVSMISGEDLREKTTSVEDCARFCREEKKFICRGFEYCRTEKTCVLHSKHVMDLGKGEFIESKKKSTCTHYAAKFAADYYDMGYTLIKDDSDKRSEITLEECARVCSEERKDNCKSFNYCPASGPYSTDSSCALSVKVLEDKPEMESNEKCHHFEKKEIVDDWAKTSNKVKKVVTSNDGYTKKGFTGLVIGMLALGLILGAMGFVLFSYIKSKRYGGEGMTVRFMKSDI